MNKNIAAFVPKLAQERPYAPAIVITKNRKHHKLSFHQYTYLQLETRVKQITNGLSQASISKNDRVIVMVPPSFDFFSLSFALFTMGAIPVFIDPGMGLKRIKSCIAKVRPSAFIGIAKAHVARTLFAWGSKTIQTNICVGSTFPGNTLNLESLIQTSDNQKHSALVDINENDDAAILFTSGSTGVPKGVVYKHRHFSAQVALIRSLYDIRPGEIDLPTFPLFALFDPALGMTSVIPDMDFTRPAHVNPQNLVKIIEDFGITNMFASPALLKTVATYGKSQHLLLPSIKRVISAGATASAQVLRDFSGLLADTARIYTPYGATENLPVTSIDHHDIINHTQALTEQGKGVCVGRPLSENTVTIIQITDQIVPTLDAAICVEQGVVGEVIVRGPSTTQSYFELEHPTQISKISDPNSEVAFHRMGDLGYFDATGRLWFCGRKDHRLETKDGLWFSEMVEGIFNVIPGINRSALITVTHQGQPLGGLCVELINSYTWSTIAPLLAIKLDEYSIQLPKLRFYQHPSFPVDPRHNAKINREKLALWARKQRAKVV